MASDRRMNYVATFLKLTRQPEPIVKEEVQKLLQFGILYVTDEASVKADKIDLGFIDQLYENSMQASKDDDVAKVFSFRNEIRRIKIKLKPQNYDDDDEKEYQSVLDKHNEFSNELNRLIEDRMSDVRETIDYFRQKLLYTLETTMSQSL